MRSVTVDTRGFGFALKLVLMAAVLTGVWQAWTPLQELMYTAAREDASTLSGVAQTDPVERAAAIESIEVHAEAPTSRGAAMLDTTAHTYVWVDVEDMTVSLFSGDQEVLVVPIQRVPPQDSPDALVPGSYTVDAVALVQTSTVAKVRFPSYVKFGDRYALHGVPTEAQGGPLTSDFAGTSVLLRTDDAAKIADFVEEGMMVYVEGPSATLAAVAGELAIDDNELPATSAAAYALTDMQTGQTYLLKNGDERYPIASITKLVTAAVASEVVGHGEEVAAPNGNRYMLGDLFYPLLLRSDNGVAQRIAMHVGIDAFIAHMNAYVQAHGMMHTNFGDSSGLSPKNLSTAHDLTLFAKHLSDEKAYLLGITAEASMAITSMTGSVWNVTNQNKLADDPFFRGGKLGYTDEAGQTSLAIFNVPLGSETRPIAVIVLQSKDWKQDTRTLLQWLVDSAAR